MKMTYQKKLTILNQIRSHEWLYDAATGIRDLRSYFRCRMKGDFSQHGEDKFIRSFFSNVDKGRYLDLGASHPFRISNTYSLYRLGWSGLTVEPIPRLAAMHRRWRPRDLMLNCAVGLEPGSMDFFEMTPSVASTLDEKTAQDFQREGRAVLFKRYKIPVVTLNSLFMRPEAGNSIDFLSIDVEGLDARLLSTIDFRNYRPKLICIECIDLEARRVIEEIFLNNEYRIIEEIECNIFAVPG